MCELSYSEEDSNSGEMEDYNSNTQQDVPPRRLISTLDNNTSNTEALLEGMAASIKSLVSGLQSMSQQQSVMNSALENLSK